MKAFHKAAMILMTVAMVASAISMADARGRLQGKSDAQTVARLGGIVERSGYTYKKAADNVWVVHFTGHAAGDVNVLVTSAEGIIIMGVVVAQKDSMQVTPEMMHRLLKLTHEIDRVKIGFDNDDDLFVRAEVSARLFDVEEFKSDVQQLVAGTDKIRAAIKPFLTQ